MLKELLNGNYFIYQIEDGGCGIVKANDKVEAVVNVKNAYDMHGEHDIEVDVFDIEGNRYFDDSPNVIELGWEINVD